MNRRAASVEHFHGEVAMRFFGIILVTLAFQSQVLASVESQICDEILANRLDSVVKHQNELRKSYGLPEWHSRAPVKISSHFSGATSVSNGELSVLNVDDQVLRVAWGKHHQLNWVYRFEGRELVEAVPFGKFLVNEQIEDDFLLVRNLGTNETRLWTEADLKGLYGAARVWYFDKGVLFFSKDHRSWIGSHRSRTGVWKIPKSVISKWIDENKIAFGIVGYSPNKEKIQFSVEAAIFEEAWSELAPYYVGPSEEQMGLLKKFLSGLIFTFHHGKKKPL